MSNTPNLYPSFGTLRFTWSSGLRAEEKWGELVSQESLTDTLNEWYEKPEGQPAAQVSCSSIKKIK